MRKMTGVILATVLILTAMPIVLADAHDGDVTVEPFGYLRVRPEYVRNLTDVDAANDDEFGIATYRARIGMNAMLPRDVTVTLDAQVLGYFGETVTPFAGFQGLDNGGADAHLFQGYVDMANIRDSGLSLRFGRQSMVLGDEWLVGDSEFYGGTSFDGFRLDYAYGDGNTVTAFWAKLAETDFLATGISLGAVNGTQPNGGFAFDSGSEDVDLFGVWNTWALEDDQVVDGYLLRLDHRLMQSFNVGGFELNNNTEDRWTLGVRYNKPEGEGWDLNVNAAYQFGDVAVPLGGVNEHDIRAYSLDAEAGWSFVRSNNLVNRVFVFGATYTGDDDDDDDTDRRFSVLFQDRHDRYGLADMFTGVFLPNLVSTPFGMDIFGVGFEAELGERWSIGGRGTGANVAKRPVEVNPSVLNEVDIYVHLDYSKNLSFDVGFAQVFARSFFLDNPAFGADGNASRIYVHAVAKF